LKAIVPLMTKNGGGCYTSPSGLNDPMVGLRPMDREQTRRQKRKAAKRLAEEKKVATAKVGRIVQYLRILGGFSLAATVFSLMLLPNAFWYFETIVYAAILLWAADAFFELREYRRVLQIFPIPVGIIAAFLFSWQFTFVALPIGEGVWSTGASYEPGSVVSGIPWSSQFTDIHVDVSNLTDYDYSQLDLLIKPKEPVVAFATIAPSPNASLTREMNPLVSSDFQLLNPKTGSRIDLPVEWFASTGGVRLRCDSLPAQSVVRVLLAVANIDQKTVDKNGDYVFGPFAWEKQQFWAKFTTFPLKDDLFSSKPTPTTLTITGQYVAFFRRKHVNQTVSVSDRLADTILQLRKNPPPQHP
jgi:hypothetical protein